MTLHLPIIIALLMFPVGFIIIQDWRHMRIPNEAIAVIFTLGIANIFLNKHQGYVNAEILTFGLLSLGVALRYMKGFHKPALGWGDIKLLAACGPWLRIETLPIFFIMTGLFGVFLALWYSYKKGSSYYPMGIAICLALIGSLLIGQ